MLLQSLKSLKVDCPIFKDTFKNISIYWELSIKSKVRVHCSPNIMENVNKRDQYYILY